METGSVWKTAAPIEELTLFESCAQCRAPLTCKVAEATVNGCTQQLWRCMSCEAVTRTGWVPPCWINATARVWAALEDALAAAVEDAYSLR